MRSTRSVLAFVFVIAVFTAIGVSQGRWSPEMHVKVKALASPRVAPDGKRVVYTVNEAVMAADKSEFVTQVWLSTLDGKEHVQITYGDRSSTNPKWSPDGSMIAFTSNRKDNRNQIFIIRMAGGEAEQITDGKAAVGNFEWSPDGRWIAYTMTDPKTEDEEKNDRGRNDFRWVDENVKFARLFVIPVQKDVSGKRESRRLTNDSRSVTGFDWSPDGRTIVFNHVSNPSPNDWPSSDIALVDVASGHVTQFASDKTSAESALHFSPDGKWISGTASDSGRWAQSYTIRVYPAAGGTPRVFEGSHDSQPSVIGWTPDGAKILFYEAKGTGTALYEVDVASGKIAQLDYQDAVISGVALTHIGSTIALAMVSQTAAAPPEIVAGVRNSNGGVRQITNANAEAAKLPIGKTVLIKWKSKDGRDIEGLLTYPVGYTAGTRVPTIVNIHGGPAGVFQQSFIGSRGSYPLATFAANGFAILRPNPRGSSGYGTEFRRANTKDWGVGDFQDIMTGVDKVVEMGVADPDRLGVMGWSYGGYMTSWIVTQTKRFKAASAGAPVTNLMSFNGTADIPAFVPDYFGGQSWEIPEVYAKHSAMFNVRGVTTPTLIQHGESDLRVPISQGYEFYNALKQQGIPTRMIVLPRQPHGIQEPKLQMAVMQSNLDWFEKYLSAGKP